MALCYSSHRKLIQTLVPGVEWLKLRNLPGKELRGTHETHSELMWVRQWADRAPVTPGETRRLSSLASTGGGRGTPHALSTEGHLPSGARSSPYCPHPAQCPWPFQPGADMSNLSMSKLSRSDPCLLHVESPLDWPVGLLMPTWLWRGTASAPRRWGRHMSMWVPLYLN